MKIIIQFTDLVTKDGISMFENRKNITSDGIVERLDKTQIVIYIDQKETRPSVRFSKHLKHYNSRGHSSQKKKW